VQSMAAGFPCVPCNLNCSNEFVASDCNSWKRKLGKLELTPAQRQTVYSQWYVLRTEEDETAFEVFLQPHHVFRHHITIIPA
jgi:hypothetical protein